MEWVLGILVLAIIATIAYAVAQRPEKKRSTEVRKRYAIDPEDGVRIPLAEERPPSPPSPGPIDDGEAVLLNDDRATPRTVTSNWLGDLARGEGERDPRPEPPAIGGRIVQTLDGEAVITTPPFALRSQMLSNRLGRYTNAVNKRLPAWMIACPRLRLESLVTPTPPDGRDAEDWSQWRRRVRLRAVDLVICDRRTWRPVLAIMLNPATRASRRADGSNGTATALTLGGGKDSMIDEVLGHVGLTLVHAVGKVAEDWPMIEPYVQQAILESRDDEDLMMVTEDPHGRPDPDAAVTLLKLDGEEGWALQ